MNIEEFLTLAAKEEASDLFIVAGLPLTMKVNGVMRRINEEKIVKTIEEHDIQDLEELRNKIEVNRQMILFLIVYYL